jgi:hypothetical protein
MASHIDIRTGRWFEAIETNLKAVAADQRHRKTFGPAKGFLNVYVAHNRHMLAYAAMMTGQRDLAMKHIRAMVAEFSPEFLKEDAMTAEGFVAMPLEVMVRFRALGRNPGRAGQIPGIHAVYARVSSRRPRDRICGEGRRSECVESTKHFPRARQTRAERKFSRQQ